MLGEYLKSNKIPADGSGPWIELIGKAGAASQLTEIFDSALAEYFTDDASIKVLSALTQAHQKRKLQPAKPDRILKLIKSNNPKLQSAAIGLTGQWNLAGVVGHLKKLAFDENTSPKIRRAVVASLRKMKAKPATELLVEMTENIPRGTVI